MAFEMCVETIHVISEQLLSVPQSGFLHWQPGGLGSDEISGS